MGARLRATGRFRLFPCLLLFLGPLPLLLCGGVPLCGLLHVHRPAPAALVHQGEKAFGGLVVPFGGALAPGAGVFEVGLLPADHDIQRVQEGRDLVPQRCGGLQGVGGFDAFARVQRQLLAAGHGVVHGLAVIVHDLQQLLGWDALQARHQRLHARLGRVWKTLEERLGILAGLCIVGAHELQRSRQVEMPALAHGAKAQRTADGVERVGVAARGPVAVFGPGGGIVARLAGARRTLHRQVGLFGRIAVGQVVHAALWVVQVQAQAHGLLPAIVKRRTPFRSTGVDAHAKRGVGHFRPAEVDVPEPGRALLDSLGPGHELGVHRHLGPRLRTLVLRVRLGLGGGPGPVGGLFPDLDGVTHRSLLGCRWVRGVWSCCLSSSASEF